MTVSGQFSCPPAGSYMAVSGQSPVAADMRGWMTYWGRFYRTEMDPLLMRINTYLMRWARKKYKRLRGFKRLKAWWRRVTQSDPDLFAHWAWTHRFQPTGW